MISMPRPALLAATMVLVAGVVNPLSAAVTISGFVSFSTLDNGPLDEDPTVGVFAVSDTLVIEGTIDCSDAPPLPGGASGCPVTLVTGGDLIFEAGGAIVTENDRGAGNGGDVTLEVAGDVVLHGPAASLPGARISTARNTTANPGGSQHAGAIHVMAGGDVILAAGSVVSAAAAAGTAGAVQILADGGVQIDGLVASGPTEIVDADALAGEVLFPAGAQQQGGPVTIRSTSTAGSGVVVGPTGIVVSQGDKEDAGLVLLEACGIEIRGLVASLTRDDQAAAVKLRSGEGLLVDGRDLGLPVDDPGFEGRLGTVRAGGSRGGSLTQRADLFARGDVQVLGPTPGSTANFAVTAGPGTKPSSSGGTVTVLSLDGTVSASGNAFETGRSISGDRGGSIDLQAAGDVALAGAAISAVGNFGSGSPGTGGNVFVQSFQGDLLWTGGTGDVRPVGSSVPLSRRGSIALFYCGSLDLTGTAFPTIGAPVPPFPEVFLDCSLPAPTLPPGESLPECNQPPVAADDDFTTDEDTAFGGDVLADNGHGADFDPGGDPLTVTEVNGVAADVGNLVVLPSGALLTLNADGTFTYDPNGQFEELAPGDEATDSFDYTVEEAGGLSDSATVTVTITGVDDDPEAVDDTATVAEDSGVTTIDVLANDTDVDGGPISIQSVTQPANGTVVITNAGADLTYEPNPDYCNDGSPTDDFTYTLAPGGSTATVSMTVTCVDDDPVAVDDAATVTEDSGANTIDVLANDTDVDGGPKSIQSVTQPANGTVVITNGGADLTYEPDADYCNDGSPLDTFTYTLAPGGSTATVSVTVICVDDPPVAVNDVATVVEDSGATTIDVLANDTDVDGGPKTIQSVTQPASGTVVITNGGADLTYEPAANYCNDGSPTDDFTYTLNGGSTATVSVTVTCVNDPPVAANDAFDYIGNTELRVDLAAVATPHVLATTGSGFGVLDNDGDPVEGDDLAVTSITVGACTDSTGPTFDCTDPAVGTVHMQPDGRFSFEPAAGDSGGSESFTYTVTDDGTPPASAVGTVTLTRFERVWYVDPNAAGGGDGTSASPFDSLDPLDGAGGAGDSDLAGDYIFVHAGSLALSAPMEMEANQHLVGEGAGLAIPVSLNGNGSPTVLVAAGAHPELTNGSGSAVTVTEAIPVEIVGLSLEGSVNAIDLTTNTLLGGSSTLTIGSNIFRGAGAEGLDVTLEFGTGGTLTLEVENNAWTGEVAAHGGHAVDIVRVTGTLNLAFSGNTNIKSSANGVVIDGGFIVGSTITDFSGNTVHPDTAGSGIVVSKSTFDAIPGAPYNQVAGGNTVIGTSGNGVGGSGVVLTDVAGDLAFTDLDVFADGGTGLGVTGTGAVNVGAGTGTRVTVVAGAGIVEATGGPAVSLSNLTTDLQLNSLTSTNSSSTGVSLTSVTGTFSAPSGSSITNATGTDFVIASSSAAVTYGGTITDDVGQLVSVSSSGGALKSFTGAITDGDDGDGGGISLTGNSSTIRFSGGVVLSTGANNAFTATGGGTVEVCDENPCDPGATGGLINKITTTTGTALNVANTTIGSNNLEFRSISAGTGASGPTNGIVLNTTGSSGGLKVKGTGSAGTGGTIQNCTGDGVSLTSTRNVELAWMNLTSNDDAGLYGSQVTNLTLTRLSIQNNTDALAEAGLELDNLFGVNTFTGLEVSGSTEDNINVTNDAAPGTGTLTSLVISGTGGTGSTCRILDNSSGSGNVGINIQAAGSADMNGVEIDGCFLQGNRTVALRGDAADSSQLEIGARNNVIVAGSPNQGNQGIELGAATSAQVDFFDIDNNRVGTDGVINSPLKNTGINVSAGGTSACAMSGHVRNNTVVNAGAGQSGFGIRVFQSSSCVIEANVANNVISNVGLDFGLMVESGGSSGSNGRIDAAVTNNTVSVLSDALDAIRTQARNGSTMCARITGNTTTHPNDAGCGGANPSTFCGLVVRQANTATFNLEGSGGSCPAGVLTAAQAAACVASQNNEDSVGSFAATSFTGVATNFCTNIP